ncbi:MAG: hypothetical protein PHD48_02285 [Alphaproteobacteria bacterium]|nr:hypothetical protein [Alphaproteobacteria bacterium]
MRKASGPYDLGTWMFNEKCASHMALSCTVYPEYVKDTLLIMGHVLTKTACDGAADKLADRQRVDNTNWKSRSLPSWRDTQGLLSAWVRYGRIPSEQECHDIIQSIKPADFAGMAQEMLAGPVGVCMEGNLKGLPSRAEVPGLLGAKGALSSQP